MPPETETNPEPTDGQDTDWNLDTADAAEGVDGAPEAEAPEPELDEHGNPVIPDDAATATDETEEVEHEGKKYVVPKALIPRIMKDADYTQKTQQVAEQRRALETQAQELATRQQALAQHFQQNTEATDALVAARAELVSLDQNISAYDQLIQQAEAQGNYDEAHRLRFLRQDLKDARVEASGKVDKHQGELSEAQRNAQTEVQAQHQRALDAGVQTLANDPNVKLTKPVFDAVASHLEINFGIGSTELFNTLNDPRVFKVAKAFVDRDAEVVKLRAELASLKKSGATTAARPAQTVRGQSPAGKDPDKMTTDEWMRHQDEIEAAQRSRRSNGQFGKR